MDLHQIWLVIAALIPSVGVAFLFYVVIKAMLEGDRRERLAHSRWLAEQNAIDETVAQKSENSAKSPPA